jgi:hypothetical protein
MITMLSNSPIQQHNVNRLACHITMKVVSEGSCCSMARWGARAACAEVSTGSVEASKAKHGQPRLIWQPVYTKNIHTIMQTILGSTLLLGLMSRCNISTQNQKGTEHQYRQLQNSSMLPKNTNIRGHDILCKTTAQLIVLSDWFSGFLFPCASVRSSCSDNNTL